MFVPKISRLRKVIEDSDDDVADTEMEGGDGVDDTVEATEKTDTGGEDTEVNYMSTKALGDADREVSYGFIYARHYTKNFRI